MNHSDFINRSIDRVIDDNGFMYITKPYPNTKIGFKEYYDCKITLMKNGACYIEKEDSKFLLYPNGINSIFFND